MVKRSFWELVETKWDEGKFGCVGLDLVIDHFPPYAIVKDDQERVDKLETLFRFGMQIVDATADVAAAVKPNLGFFLRYGWEGLRALSTLIYNIHERHPTLGVILDGKFNDIGSTCEAYADGAFDAFGADAITVNPYLGQEALAPLLARQDKGVFVLCKTSNPGGGEFQDLCLDQTKASILEPLNLHQYVARSVTERWNSLSNCGLVFGATYPSQLHLIREIHSEIPLLIPGVGEQGGGIPETVSAARKRFLINSSRKTLNAWKQKGNETVHFASASGNQFRQMHEDIRAAMISD